MRWLGCGEVTIVRFWEGGGDLIQILGGICRHGRGGGK
jgi:hypothetical protein